MRRQGGGAQALRGCQQEGGGGGLNSLFLGGAEIPTKISVLQAGFLSGIGLEG